MKEINTLLNVYILSYQSRTRYGRVFCRAGAAAKTFVWFFLVLLQNLSIALENDVLLIDFSV